MSTDLPIHSDSPGKYAASVVSNGNGDVLSGGGVAYAAPFAAEAEAKGGGIRRYLETLLRHKWVVVGIILLGSALGVVASRFQKKTYVVQGTVWMDNRGVGRAGPIQDAQLLQDAAWDQLLKSFLVLDNVVMTQRLYLDVPDEHQRIFADFSVDSAFYKGNFELRKSGRNYVVLDENGNVMDSAPAGDSLGRKAGWKWAPRAGSIPDEKVIKFTLNTPRDVAVALGRQVQSNFRKEGAFMQLELQGEDPGRLRRTMNALIDRFVTVAAELKRAKLDEYAKLLKEQLLVAEQNLQADEIALENLKVQNITLPSEVGTIAVGQNGQATPTSTYMAVKLQSESIRSDRAALKRAATNARDSAFSVAELEAIPAVQNASELKTALNEITTKRAEVRANLYKYTEQHPEVKRLLGEIEVLNKETVPVMVRRLDDELARRETQLSNSLATAEEELRTIPPRLMEEAKLNRQRSIAENLYTRLRERNEEAELAALSSTPDLRVIDPAKLPRRPLRDQRMQIILLAIIGSIGLAVGGVLVFDHFDPRVRYPEQITHGLRLPILAAVPQLKGHNGNGARNSENMSQAVEAFRGLRLTLLHAAGGDGRLVTAITSPGSGDGKSFVAMNLALAFAEQGYRTILIDGDTRRGTLHRFVGCSRKPGLTDLLAGTANKEQVIQSTSYPRLNLLPCGTRLQSGPELLGSPEMPALVRDLRSRYDVVLIDSPPLGAGVDPFVLGTTTGSLMIVLRAGYTDREYTEAKLSVLDGLPIRVIGAILNGVSAGGAYRYYSYLAGYEANDESPVIEETSSLPAVT
jgi:capsular exopolysaccharide synthesis family protein